MTGFGSGLCVNWRVFPKRNGFRKTWFFLLTWGQICLYNCSWWSEMSKKVSVQKAFPRKSWSPHKTPQVCWQWQKFFFIAKGGRPHERCLGWCLHPNCATWNRLNFQRWRFPYKKKRMGKWRHPARRIQTLRSVVESWGEVDWTHLGAKDHPGSDGTIPSGRNGFYVAFPRVLWRSSQTVKISHRCGQVRAVRGKSGEAAGILFPMWPMFVTIAERFVVPNMFIQIKVTRVDVFITFRWTW